MSVSPETVATLDYHVAGEPLRILLDAPEPLGGTMAEKAATARSGVWARLRSVVSEPRGHAEMFGAFRTAPVRPDSDFGALFFDANPASAFKMACGHGTIALAAAALAEGWVPPQDGWNQLRIDVPSGQVGASVLWTGKTVQAVRYRHVPSRLRSRDRCCPTSLGTLLLDLVDAGAQVAIVPLAGSSLTVDIPALPRLRETYLEVKAALTAQDGQAPDLVLFHDPLQTSEGIARYTGAAFFGEGNLDRSPCGTASSAMATLLHATGRIASGQQVRAQSPVGTHFEISVPEAAAADGTVLPMIETRPYATGRAVWTLDPQDPLCGGFFLG